MCMYVYMGYVCGCACHSVHVVRSYLVGVSSQYVSVNLEYL